VARVLTEHLNQLVLSSDDRTDIGRTRPPASDERYTGLEQAQLPGHVSPVLLAQRNRRSDDRARCLDIGEL
jgi:hypothetical protein